MIWMSDRTYLRMGEGDVLMQGAHRHHRDDRGDDRGDGREESKHRCWEPKY
jgi:hypothetical protein